MTPRTIVWFSTGAASAVAARMVPEAILVRCETGAEDEDNHRFEADVCAWLGRSVTVLQSEKYASVDEVWEDRRYMSGIHGAPCTGEMKLAPRLAFQRPDDIHIFGYTADAADVERFKRLRETYFELTVRAPLIEAGISKAAALAIIERAGIVLPRSYAMGFPNANCLRTGCVKASSANYWALLRHHFPGRFGKTSAQSRRLGCRLTRLNGERAFIDEIPLDQPMTQALAPACDFLCHIAEMDIQK